VKIIRPPSGGITGPLCSWWDINLEFTTEKGGQGPTLWSSGQDSWLQIKRSGFDSRRYQIFWGIVGLERDPLSLVSTTEKLLGRKSGGSGLEIREYSRRDPSRCPRGTLYPQKLALISPMSGGRSVGIVRSRTHATGFSSILVLCALLLFSHKFYLLSSCKVINP
jgi:hypothetical protein